MGDPAKLTHLKAHDCGVIVAEGALEREGATVIYLVVRADHKPDSYHEAAAGGFLVCL